MSEERNARLRDDYARGVPVADLRRSYGISKQRIHQILRSSAQATPSLEHVTSARRTLAAQRAADRLEELRETTAGTIRAAAARGADRAAVVHAVQQTHPELEVTGGEVDALMRVLGTRLTPRRSSLYDAEALRGAILAALATIYPDQRHAPELGGLEGDEGNTASWWSACLAPHVPDDALADVVAAVVAGQTLAASNQQLTLTDAQYRAARHRLRGRLARERDLQTWPPDSGTVASGLGGTWRDACHAAGLGVNARGRAVGAGRHSRQDAEAAVRHFTAMADRPTRAAYEGWRTAEAAAGRHWPSASVVIRLYGSWTNAQRAGDTAPQPSPGGPTAAVEP